LVGQAPIEPLDHESAKQAAARAGLPEYMATLNIFRVLLKEPVLARGLNDLLTNLIFKAPLPHRLRELVILRVAWRTGSAYEWAQHYEIAKAFGLSEEEILAARAPSPDERVIGPEGALVMRLADAMTSGQAISQDLLSSLRESLGEAGLIDAVGSVAAWHMVAMILSALSIEVEEGKSLWPPDGAAPRG
jgi:alkylhydroperoxidase family enzyme